MRPASTQYKVDINPSYEWAEEAHELNISHRELEVFALVGEGYKNKEIAQILRIQHQSVKNHMYSFMKKLGVKNGMQAFILALHLKLVKLRYKTPYKDSPVIEMTGDTIIDNFRKFISGEAWSSKLNEKQIRSMKVFLKEHGIDPYNW